MPSERAARLLLVAALLLAPAGEAERIESVVASVDGRPVLLTERQALEAVKNLAPSAAREALVDQFLMEREALRFPALAPSTEEVERLTDGLAARAAEVPRDALRRLARREALILRYVDFRFRPLVQVEEAEVERDWQAMPDPRPPLPEVREALREARARRVLDERVEAWIKELRRAARVRYASGGWRRE